MSETKTKTIRYERETCGRCGGAGRYSFNTIDGDVCYGCGGSRKRISRRGRAAQKAIRAFQAERYSKTLLELEPGDSVRLPGGARRWHRLEAVVFVDDPKRRSRSRSGGESAPWVEYLYRVELRGLTTHANPDAVFELRPTPAQFVDEVVPFARAFDGKGLEIILEED